MKEAYWEMHRRKKLQWRRFGGTTAMEGCRDEHRRYFFLEKKQFGEKQFRNFRTYWKKLGINGRYWTSEKKEGWGGELYYRIPTIFQRKKK